MGDEDAQFEDYDNNVKDSSEDVEVVLRHCVLLVPVVSGFGHGVGEHTECHE